MDVCFLTHDDRGLFVYPNNIQEQNLCCPLNWHLVHRKLHGQKYLSLSSSTAHTLPGSDRTEDKTNLLISPYYIRIHYDRCIFPPSLHKWCCCSKKVQYKQCYLEHLLELIVFHFSLILLGGEVHTMIICSLLAAMVLKGLCRAMIFNHCARSPVVPWENFRFHFGPKDILFSCRK